MDSLEAAVTAVVAAVAVVALAAVVVAVAVSAEATVLPTRFWVSRVGEWNGGDAQNPELIVTR